MFSRPVHSCPGETGHKRPELGIFDWPCDLRETGDCKPKRPCFLLCSCSEETGYKRPELGVSDVPCNLRETGSVWLILAL